MKIKKPKRYLARKADVLAFFGGYTATTEAFGLSSGAVAQWGEYIPQARARELREMVGDQFDKLRIVDADHPQEEELVSQY